jgi:hypothetical protein
VPVVPRFGGSFTADDVFVRGCDSQIFASDAAANTHSGDRIGSLELFGLRDAPNLNAALLTPNGNDELGIQKYVTTLRGDETVWLAVAPQDRPYVSLIYDPSRWFGGEEGLPLDAGDPVVRFDACDNPSGFSQYNGGILVLGPRCVTFNVWSAIGAEPLGTVLVPFGVGADCALVRLSVALPPGESREMAFDSPGLDWTASTTVVGLSNDSDVSLSIRATQGTLYLLEGRPSDEDGCLTVGNDGYACTLQWPILEAQSDGEWTLVAESRSPEQVTLDVTINSDFAIGR